MVTVSHKQIGRAFYKAYMADTRINRTHDVDWQLKDFGYLHNCRVHTVLDAGGDPCLDYMEFNTAEEVTVFLLKWA
jgi:hypothetical protein